MKEKQREMEIYKEVLEMIEGGVLLKISLKERTLTIGRKRWINKGVVKENCTVEIKEENLEQVLEKIEELYAVYNHSLPGKGQRNSDWFEALPEEMLDEDDYLYAPPRRESLDKLELYTLCALVSGKLYWDKEKMGKWFWASKKEKNLVLLRNWIETNNTDNLNL